MEKYHGWNFSSFRGWAPGKKGMIVVTRDGQINQLYRVANAGAAPKRLTSMLEPVTDVAVCPDSARRVVLFTKDSGGNENFQIFALGLDSAGPRMLTDGKGQNVGMAWSASGDRFAFSSNKRNGSDFDIFVCDVRNPCRVCPVLARSGSWSVEDWSPNDSLLLVSHYLSRTACFLYLCNWRTGEVSPLHDTLDTVSQEIGAWGPRGRGVFFTSDKGTNVRTLRYMDLLSRRETTLTAAIPWDVREIAMSRNRSMLAFQTNQNGYSGIYLMNTASLAFQKVPGLPEGGVYGLKFDPFGEYLGITVTTARQPEEAYALRLSDFSLVRWTSSGLGGLDSNAFVHPDLITYPTFDSVDGVRRRIPCFIYKPTAGPGRFPVLIDVHGGPESQFWPYFKPAIQYDVKELGVCVLAPNIRGSGGYGQEYLSLDNGYKREDAIKDIGALLDWVAGQPGLDTSRIGISGGSYGGYVSLASLVRFGPRFRAGIDMYGICNFLTFLQRTAAYRRDLRRVEYGDERVAAMHDFLARISPLTNASKIACPLFILQGTNDPRVPESESDQIAAAVRAGGKTVWTITARDEGHGFRRKANEDFQECAQAFFLRTFLAGKENTPP